MKGRVEVERRKALARVAGCAQALGTAAVAALPAQAQTPAAPAVLQAHAETARSIERAGGGSFADADRGFVAAPSGQVRDAAGEVVRDYGGFAFVQGAAPPTVNPSLWRQALC